jgi:hypothetical protein
MWCTADDCRKPSLVTRCLCVSNVTSAIRPADVDSDLQVFEIVRLKTFHTDGQKSYLKSHFACAYVFYRSILA